MEGDNHGGDIGIDCHNDDEVDCVCEGDNSASRRDRRRAGGSMEYAVQTAIVTAIVVCGKGGSTQGAGVGSARFTASAAAGT